MSEFAIQYEETVNEVGERVYGQLNTGEWWERTEESGQMPTVLFIYWFLMELIASFLQNAILLPLILYLDGTWLSRGGGHNCTPLSVTLGNFTQEARNKPYAKKVSCTLVGEKLFKNRVFWQLLAYMPDLGGTKQQKKTVGYRRTKKEVYHSSLHFILEEVKQCNDAGGFWALRVQDQIKTLLKTRFFNLVPCFNDRRARNKKSCFGQSLL